MEFITQLYRETDEPWGFRMIGGIDFSMPLTVVKVLPNSPADRAGLHNGDSITSINDADASAMTHDDSRQALALAGKVLTLTVVRGLYDPVLDDFEPIYESIDQPDSDQLLDPTEVPDPNTDICPEVHNLLTPVPMIDHLNPTFDALNGQGILKPLPIDPKDRDSDFSRSLTASPYVGQAKPYRPFSTEPQEVPPLEDPIILNPDYHDVFKKLGIDEDYLPKTRFKLPISEQYDPDGTRKKGKVGDGKIESLNIATESVTKQDVNVNESKFAEETVMKGEISYNESKIDERLMKEEVSFNESITEESVMKNDASFKEEVKKDIDLDIVETATIIVDETLCKAVSVAEEIQKQMEVELIDTSNIRKVIKSTDKQDISVKNKVENEQFCTEITDKTIDTFEGKSETKEQRTVEASKVCELVDLIDKTTEEIMKQNESSVENNEQITKVNNETKTELDSKYASSSYEDENIYATEVYEESMAEDRRHESSYKSEDIHKQTFNTRTYDEKCTLEQKAYVMGLQTIPNIRGIVHSSYHYNLLLQTFFLHLTDVMVALSRFILSQPVFDKDVKPESQKTKGVEKEINKVVRTQASEVTTKHQKKETAKVEIKEKKERKEVTEQKVQQQQQTANQQQIEGKQYANEIVKESYEKLSTTELDERRKLSGSRMAQLVEKKSEELTNRMDAVITEFQTKAGIEETVHERSSSRQEEVIQESAPALGILFKVDRKTEERVNSEVSEVTSSTETERKSRSKSRDRNMYVAIVESHVYTNKDVIFDEQTDDFVETSSVVSANEVNVALQVNEAVNTEAVTLENREVETETARTMVQEQQVARERAQTVRRQQLVAPRRENWTEKVVEQQKEAAVKEQKLVDDRKEITETIHKQQIVKKEEPVKTAELQKTVIKEQVVDDKKEKAQIVRRQQIIVPKKEDTVKVVKEEKVIEQQSKDETVQEERQETVVPKKAEIVEEKQQQTVHTEKEEKVQIVRRQQMVLPRKIESVKIEEEKAIEEVQISKQDEKVQIECAEQTFALKKKEFTSVVKDKEIVIDQKPKQVTIQRKLFTPPLVKKEIKEEAVQVQTEVKEKQEVIQKTFFLPVKKEPEVIKEEKIEIKKEADVIQQEKIEIKEKTHQVEEKAVTKQSTIQKKLFQPIINTNKEIKSILKVKTDESMSKQVSNTIVEEQNVQITETKIETPKLKLDEEKPKPDTKTETPKLKLDTDLPTPDTKTPSPILEPPTPLVDEYVFKLEIPLPKRSATPVPRDCTPTPEDEDPDIVKRKFIPFIDTKIEHEIKYDPPLKSPPTSPNYCNGGLKGGANTVGTSLYSKQGLRGGTSKYGFPPFYRYTKPGLRGGADDVDYRKAEILEIGRKSSLLASAIDETIKSIEEYKEEVGIKQNQPNNDTDRVEITTDNVANGYLVYNGFSTVVETKIYDNSFVNTVSEISGFKDENEINVNADTKTLNFAYKDTATEINGFKDAYEINVNADSTVPTFAYKDTAKEFLGNTDTVIVETNRNNPVTSKEDDFVEMNNVSRPVASTIATDVERVAVVEEKRDPMEGYRPVPFNPDELQNVIEQHRQARMAGVPIMTVSQERELYKNASGEIIGTVQGIVGGLEEAVVEPDNAKDLGKPGITEEKIAELISGESEMLREAHVMGLRRVLASHMHRPDDDSSVDFKRIKPLVESLKDSEVLKAINDEILKKAKEEKKKDDRKWTTFLQKPKRPVPKAKFGYYGYVEPDAKEIEEPYKVKIVKQPKPKVAPDYKPEDFNTGLLPWEERALREPTPPPVAPEEPILVPEESPEILEAVDPLPESEVPDLEDSGIPLPEPKEPTPPPEEGKEEQKEVFGEELDLDAVVEETEKIVEESIVEEMDQMNLGEQLLMSVQNMVDPSAPLDQQLAQMRAQLAALAQLPCVIQQSLEMVTKQLGQLSQMEAQQQLTAQTETEAVTETQQDQQIVEETKEVVEESHQVQEEEVAEERKQEPTPEELEKLRREEQEIIEEQKRMEKIKKEQMEKLEQERLEYESRQVKQRATPRVGKPKPVFGPMSAEPRPLVLPGGRKWRGPKDAYNEQFFTETLAAQAEIIQGKTKGCQFESVLLPYDDRINFMKWEKPPVNLDHLQNSEVYKLVHNMDNSPLRRVDMLTPVVAEADYREKCRSITPCTERMAREEHLDIPQQVQP